MDNEKSFLQVAQEYAGQRELSPVYRDHLIRTARRMAAAGIDSVAAVSAEKVNHLLDSVRGSSHTRAANRRMCCTLIRAALGQRASKITDQIRRVKVLVPPPVAWSDEELERLLKAASGMTRTLISGCPASLFFKAWILVGFTTCLRFSDLHGLRVNQLRGNRLYVVQSKTSQPITKVLPDEVVALLRQLAEHPKGDGTFFLWALKEHWLRVWFRRLCKQAGLEGSSKWLRRTGATACEAESPGSASRALGHKSPELAMKFYVDASLLPNSSPVPKLKHKWIAG